MRYSIFTGPIFEVDHDEDFLKNFKLFWDWKKNIYYFFYYPFLRIFIFIIIFEWFFEKKKNTP